jgi:ADP-ribose pyrophosphatase
MPKRPSGPVGGFVTESIKGIHEWALWSLVQGKFTGPDGATFTRSFVTSPGAVGVVALQELTVARTPYVVLVRQYRPALHRLTLELPAGMRDQPDEPALETAQRELREEVGLTARDWTRLGCHVSAPGISDSQVELFLARSLEQVEVDRHGPEEQHMTIEEVALPDALAMVADGVIDDAKTVIGLLLTEQLLRRG